MEYSNLKIGGEKFSVWFYDTETHNDTKLVERLAEEYQSGKRPLSCDGVGVWLWYCIGHETGDFKTSPHGYSVKEFIDWLDARSRTGSRMVYVFNLAFEVSYLLPYLLRSGWAYGDKGEHTFSLVSNESISSVYTLRLNMDPIGCRKVIFKDLHKRIPGGSLRQLAKDYRLPIQKAYIDGKDNGQDGYLKDRHGNYTPTPEELYYCWADCKVCEELYCLKVDEYNERIKEHPLTDRVKKDGTIEKIKTERTDEFKEFFDSCSSASYACKMMIHETYPLTYERKDGKAKKYSRRQQFRDEFPKLGETTDTFVRRSYEGGLCYPTAWVRNKDLGKTLIGHADVVSQYPSQIITRKKFPYGFPEWVNPSSFHGEEEGYRYLLQVQYRYTKVKMIPSLRMTGVVGIWYSDFDSIGEPIRHDFQEEQVRGVIPETMFIWDFYIPTRRRCLEGFDYKVVKALRFKAEPSPFAPYFLEHFNLKNRYKKEGLSAKKRNEKLLINQPTGKFGERPHNDNRECFLGDGGYPERRVSEKDNPTSEAKFTYTPFISAVTAYAREFLLRTADYLGFENICYMDTDSLRFFWNKDTEEKSKNPELFGNTLMHFEQDEIWTDCLFAKPKSYRYTNIKDRSKGRKTGGYHNPNYDELKDKLCGNEDGTAYQAEMRRMVDTPMGKVRIPVKHAFYNRPW